jgi:acyl-coenzyme A synthetase/AMP-(fatty) acid ligase/acyl carrier protein
MPEFSNPSTRLPQEQQVLRAKCFHPTGTFVEFKPEDVEQSITARFEKQAALYPDQIAVKTRRHSVSYLELNRAADQVAHAILHRTSIEKQPIALLFENGAPFVIASLGALKAGKIQVSLESTFPPARLRYVLEQSQAAMLVTDNANFSLARQLGNLPVVNIDEIGGRFPAAEIGISVTPHDPVAIGYSSGSTGEPKGMVWNHRGLLHAVMRHTNMSHMCAHDRLVMFRTSFRAYLYALLNGATYYPVDLHQDEAPELAEWLIWEKITMYRAAVSAFRSFAGALKGTEPFPHLRLILLFGEPVYHADVELYRRRFSDHTLLGSTLGCMEFDDYAYFFVDRNSTLPGGVLPGGYPIADAEILLLGDDGRPGGPGQIGEIAIRSRYNPVGYWRRDDLTQTKFLGQPGSGDERIYLTGDLGRIGPDGCIVHQGRKDFEVKIRGYRVDIGEVETVLTEIEGVKQAIVVGWEDNPGNKRLIAYVVPVETHKVTVTELRRILAEKLPDYMVPSAFITLSRLPLTATGKIDRRALPPPDRTRPLLETSFVAPRTPAEEKLAAIWSDVLGLDRVGVNDSFLELGGDSLSATQVITRVSLEFEVRVPLRLLFDAPTIAEMATVIAQSNGRETEKRKPDPILSRRLR